ncbi:TLD domain-containing protein 2-like [Heracleum sosnowskyi]|uniref:TLD domain-containing protein 2-like n=1 Tax=Heracleum sosnowskyi TaxID=360622 RepID=A0AAD8MNX9_9APIA|nr:TLD domain-containing protein 2-like [Heracleum sosnowskyi]
MYSLKDKVSDKLSLLFSDSPSSLPQSQATQDSKEGKTFSSLLSYVLPSTSFNKTRSGSQNDGINPIQSNYVRWKNRSFSQQDVPSENYVECKYKCVTEETLTVPCKETKQGSVIGQAFQEEENFYTPKVIEDQVSRCTNGSDIFEDAIDQHNSGNPMPKLTQESHFLSTELYKFLQSSLPNIVKGCEWVLLYSTVKHGISLRTLIRNSADLPGPCLLITGDMQGAIFGGMFEGPLRPTAKRKYQGTIQTFVFTTIDGEPRLFRPKGANRYFYLCLNDLLALGGGGDFALRLDGDLLSGTSGPCDTFGNQCLAHNREFEVKNVELWGFTHISRYTK